MKLITLLYKKMEKLCEKVEDGLKCGDVIECDDECSCCSEEDENEDDEREDDLIIRSKWQCDGSATIDEAIEKLHAYIDYLKALKADGYELTGPVEDDYGFLRKTPLPKPPSREEVDDEKEEKDADPQ